MINKIGFLRTPKAKGGFYRPIKIFNIPKRLNKGPQSLKGAIDSSKGFMFKKGLRGAQLTLDSSQKLLKGPDFHFQINVS